MSKRKATDSESSPPTDLFAEGPISFTSRRPQWAYLQLELVTDPSTSTPAKNLATLDALSARTYLTSALSQFLGVSGTAIPIDILKIEAATPPSQPQPGKPADAITAPTSCPNILWVRVPYGDATAVITAVSSWVGGDAGSAGSNAIAFRVRSRGGLLGGLTNGGGGEMFVP